MSVYSYTYSHISAACSSAPMVSGLPGSSCHQQQLLLTAARLSVFIRLYVCIRASALMTISDTHRQGNTAEGQNTVVGFVNAMSWYMRYTRTYGNSPDMELMHFFWLKIS